MSEFGQIFVMALVVFGIVFCVTQCQMTQYKLQAECVMSGRTSAECRDVMR